jgi:hypothetical protein
MKRLFLCLLVGLSAITLLTGCLDLQLGGGTKSDTTNTDHHPAIGQQLTAPTLGQQLMDLQKAKDSGAITDAEYQAQKAKLLENK